jgi:hypothetical protein
MRSIPGRQASRQVAEGCPRCRRCLRLGTANYIIGSLPGTKKFFLGFAGIHGDKKRGIEQLETAANHGHYLRPFAKVLLALTALREKKREVARAQLTELVAEFPENTLFAVELAKLNVRSSVAPGNSAWRRMPAWYAD